MNNAAFGTNAGNSAGEKAVRRTVQTVTITPGGCAWVEKSMPADLYRTVTERFGEFPGKSFRTPEGDLAMGRIQFGNVILMPQSLPAKGATRTNSSTASRWPRRTPISRLTSTCATVSRRTR
ncbi:MAG: hypothetical protein V8T86_01975 [Victivallis sp.]